MRSVGDHDHDLSCSESSDNSLVKRNGFNRPVKNLIVLSQILIVLSKISIVLSQILIVLFRISSFLLRIVLKMSKRFVSWKLNRNLANRLGSEPLFQHWPEIPLRRACGSLVTKGVSRLIIISVFLCVAALGQSFKAGIRATACSPNALRWRYTR